ncbi:hypothetical protein, partial [Nostoc sp. NMS2]|uniref:hypothetical protein n=2 Tax=unclassified Nostoc TaxID=2593658 RepID=UPI0025F0DBA3
ADTHPTRKFGMFFYLSVPYKNGREFESPGRIGTYVNRFENIEPTGNTVGLDVGLKEYYTQADAVTFVVR